MSSSSLNSVVKSKSPPMSARSAVTEEVRREVFDATLESLESLSGLKLSSSGSVLVFVGPVSFCTVEILIEFSSALASSLFLEALLVFLAGDRIDSGFATRRGFFASLVGVSLEAGVGA